MYGQTSVKNDPPCCKGCRVVTNMCSLASSCISVRQSKQREKTPCREHSERHQIDDFGILDLVSAIVDLHAEKAVHSRNRQRHHFHPKEEKLNNLIAETPDDDFRAFLREHVWKYHVLHDWMCDGHFDHH